MAALSKPSLRSSTRKTATLDHVPPADSLPVPRRGKRTRNSSLGSQSSTSVKRFKSSPQEPPCSNPIVQFPQSLPIRDKAVPKPVGTQVGRPRKEVDPPQPHIELPAIAKHNEQAFRNNNSVDLNTFDVLNTTEKRSLRSHDGGSRSKSELALYFANYDELVSIEPKEPDFLTPETLLQITDEAPKATASSTISPSTSKTTNNKSRRPSKPPDASTNDASKPFALTEEIFITLNDATRIDLSATERQHVSQDPLVDSVYLKAHRRAERQEKQLRNIEKERAMHEKVQLERLLDGLKGHDWLRVMGISGITDGEKKAFEPKRGYFMHEVRILLEKFKEWKEEEKRRKIEKEDSVQEEEGQDEAEDEEDQEQANSESDGDPPDYQDVHDSAASQVPQDITPATTTQPRRARSRRTAPSMMPPVEKPFTSFYSKPYLRDAAIGKHRRGRKRFAFGQPLPEPVNEDFSLPETILNPEAIVASARRSRRAKRESKA